MSRFPDPVAEGLTRGWRVLDASRDPLPATLRADVAIIGSGAGGGITAEVLARAGLKVVLIEEGPLKTSRDFSMRENEAYPQLYQESAARKNRDQAITILQGRCVGGSTTVNWTSSFRTPDETLHWWGERWALPGYEPEALSPWFAQAERRLGIGPWLVPPNGEQRPAAPWRHETRHPGARDPAQRPRLPEPGLLRHGLPGQRQAVDAGDDDPSRARARRDAAHPGAGAASAHRRAARRGDRGAGARCRRAATVGSCRRDPRGACRARRRRDQLACGAAALEGARSACHRRYANLPPSRRAVGGRPRAGGPRLRGCAPDPLYRSLPRHRPDRRADRLQARGAAHPSGTVRGEPRGTRSGARRGDAALRTRARAARPDARRLP